MEVFMYRSAFLGCGGRARGHANAYKDITRSEMAAICDLNEERLNSFGDNFGIAHRYTDIHEMLEKEKPDLLHIVTPPDLRVPLMTIAAEHDVPAAIVEKPVAVDGADYKAIVELGEKSKTKFVVNHQLRFHPKFLELREDVLNGRIGKVRLVEVSARLNLAGQGTHVNNLMFALNDCVVPVSVFGQVSGGSALNSSHAAPDMAEAAIMFENGVRGILLCGNNAPSVGDYPGHYHKRACAYGTLGFVEWQMESWERSTPDNGYESGSKSYGAEDVLGQKGLTEAVFDWLDDEGNPHPNRLEVSLTEFNMILGLYTSALKRQPVDVPVEPEDKLIDALRGCL